MTEGNIGIDISKSHLDAYRLEDEAPARFENSQRGLKALIKWLGATPVARVVYEPTGPYHRAFDSALSGKFPLVKVNPLQARRFAQSCGTRAKTDAVDARSLARMGAALALEPDAPISEKLLDLRDLQVARTGLVKERTRLRNRGQVQTNAVLKRQTRTRLALVERQIAELNAAIAKHIADDQPTARKRDIPKLHPRPWSDCHGIDPDPGPAFALRAFGPDGVPLAPRPGGPHPGIGTLERKQAGSLAGLVPHSRESGQWKGKSFGGKMIPRIIFCSALSYAFPWLPG